jgi:hypothetical protein
MARGRANKKRSAELSKSKIQDTLTEESRKKVDNSCRNVSGSGADRARCCDNNKNAISAEAPEDNVFCERSQKKPAIVRKITNNRDTFDNDENLPNENNMSFSELMRHEHHLHRKEARRVHSNGPMFLSRRMSFKLTRPDLSPKFSPLAACKLSFSPVANNISADCE